MSTNNDNFTEKSMNPIIQGAVVLSFAFLIMIIIKIMQSIGYMGEEKMAFWIVAGSSLLLYAMFSSMLSLSAKDMNKYWVRSTASYAVLMISVGVLAYLFTGLTIGEAASIKWIFMVLTFGYLLFLSMMRFMRKIVQIAQQEDKKWINRVK